MSKNTKNTQVKVLRRAFAASATIGAFVFSAAGQGVFLGPANPGFELGNTDWFSGGTGGAAGSVTMPTNGVNGPSEPGGTNAVLETSDGAGNTDFRAAVFSLGPAAGGSNTVIIQFDYNILGSVTPNNNVRVGFRTWAADNNNNFEGELNAFIGDNTGDAGGDGWHTYSETFTPSTNANFADMRISMNVFNGTNASNPTPPTSESTDFWTDGAVLFDNFVVVVIPKPQKLFLGPANPGFELGNADWFSGGTGGAAGSVVMPTNGVNGPSAPGTNAVLETSDGAGNTDFRAATFSLGGAAGGRNTVTMTFDYNILGTVTPNNNVRVGLRTWLANNNNNFEGENNVFIGDNTGDTGGTGWQTYTETYTPSANANFADIRVSMNVFNGTNASNPTPPTSESTDFWTDGAVLFDNFQVTLAAPAFSGWQQAGNTLTATVTGLTAGQPVVLQSSSDLVTWTPVQTNTPTGSILLLPITFNSGAAAQFFTVSLP